MKQKILFCLFLFFTYSLVGWAGIEIRSTRITMSDGLANNSVRCIYQDSKGFIWLGTQNGLSRYDGNSFITFRPQKDRNTSLSDHRVHSLLEDKNGFLWIATQADLVSCFNLKSDCFVDYSGNGTAAARHYRKILLTVDNEVWLWGQRDGCRRVIYKNGHFSVQDFDLNHVFKTNEVNDVLEDGRGRIWFATDKGLFYWDGKDMRLVNGAHDLWRLKLYNGNVFCISGNGDLYRCDRQMNFVTLAGNTPMKGLQLTDAMTLKNELYIFTPHGGYCYNMDNGGLKKAEAPYDMSNAGIVYDNLQNCWLYNKTGSLYYVESSTGEVTRFKLMPESNINFIDVERYQIVQDKHGVIWITTYGNGLFAYDKNTKELMHFQASENDLQGYLGSNFVQALLVDRSGNVWVSSEYTGLSRISVINEGATRIYPYGTPSFDWGNAIRMLQRNKDGNIYVGNRNGDVYEYTPDLNHILKAEHFNTNIYAALTDEKGVEWLCTRVRGLLIGGKEYRHKANDPSSLSFDQTFCLLQDKKKNIWVGTFGGGLDLAVSQGDGYVFRHFFNETDGMKRIRALCEDRNGWIWVGTSDGLFCFYPDRLLKNPRDYYRYSLDKGSIKTDEIRSIVMDSKGRIWIAETGAGFAVCTPGKDYSDLVFEHYDVSDGLINPMVLGFVEDLQGNMWITTEYGVSRFDMQKKLFENYLFSSNLQGNVYGDNSTLRLDDGRLAFGSRYGLTVVDPLKLRRKNMKNEVVFTDLKLNGESVRPGQPDSPLDSALAYSSVVNLKYDQNSFNIEFSIMDYSDREKYMSKLENYDKEWSVPSSLGFVAYKNLSPGTYYLHVKACNSLGVWSDQESVLKIVVSPPFWRSYWAYALYIIVLLALLYFTYRILNKMNTLRYKIAMEEQLTEYKLVFFTNISHEFRTPLTLIQGALEKIHRIGGLTKEQLSSIKIMDKSTQRMLRLINQLLEFRKMQNRKLSLALEEMDVIPFLQDIYQSFMDIAESKHMEYTFETDRDSYRMFVDKGHLDKIVYNLLSNAFKYTPSRGKIVFSVAVDENAKKIRLQVSDTGVGIPKQKQGELFHRFMQSSFSGSSMGVGLHLTHELVVLQKGTIRFSENPLGGSIFTVELPTDSSIFEEKDFLVPDNAILREEVEAEKHFATEMKKENSEVEVPEFARSPLNKRKVLIVEDDMDVRNFLQQEISPYFEVLVASNGNEGFDIAKNTELDLIISDVMMPVCSGFDMTRKLRNDLATSHIPIILLTALDSDDNHVKGVGMGADAYITKPFSMQLLLTRAFKLIEQREKLKEKFSNDPKEVRSVLCSSDADRQFVDKMIEVVESQLSNAQFSVDEFASMMCMGRSLFYRKVRGVTGYSPNEYIRIMRMKKAATLLRQTNMTISEVSYQVGLNDPFYFSKCFKSQFGITPSAYQKGEEPHPDKGNTASNTRQHDTKGEEEGAKNDNNSGN